MNVNTDEQEDICAECGHKRRDHASDGCVTRIGSSGGRDVYCPCGMFQSEEDWQASR